MEKSPPLLQTSRQTFGHCMFGSGCRFPPRPLDQGDHPQALQSGDFELGSSQSPSGSSADNSPCCCRPGRLSGHRDSRLLGPNLGTAQIDNASDRRPLFRARRNLDSPSSSRDSIAQSCSAKLYKAAFPFLHVIDLERAQFRPFCSRSFSTFHASGRLRSQFSQSRTGTLSARARRRAGCFRPEKAQPSLQKTVLSNRSIGGF